MSHSCNQCFQRIDPFDFFVDGKWGKICSNCLPTFCPPGRRFQTLFPMQADMVPQAEYEMLCEDISVEVARAIC